MLLVFAGNAAFTVTTAVREQPDAFVYDIVASPVPTPVTIPPVAVDATLTSLLLHVRPVGLEPSVVVLPTHSVRLPVIADGDASTVIDRVRRQPVDNVYVTVAAPAATPVTVPVDPPIVATVDGVIVHIPPPPVVSDNVVVAPTHTVPLPAIMPGRGFTLTSFVLKQPVALILYVIVVVPADTPITTPVVLPTVPTAVVLLSHVPPAGVAVRFVVVPTQIGDVPPDGVAGLLFTVTTTVR